MNRRALFKAGLVGLVGTGALIAAGCSPRLIGSGLRAASTVLNRIAIEEEKKKAIEHETPRIYTCKWKDNNGNNTVDSISELKNNQSIFTMNDDFVVAVYLANPAPVDSTIVIQNMEKPRTIFRRTFSYELAYRTRCISWRQNTIPAGRYHATAKTSAGVELSCDFEVRQSDK